MGPSGVRHGRVAVLVGVIVAWAAVLGACSGSGEGSGAGPGDGAGAEGTTSSTGGAPSSAPGPGQAPGLTLDVEWSPAQLRPDQDVVWRLRLTNGGAEPVELAFSTGKSGDVTLTREGAVVYSWSDDRVFTQVVRTESLGGGESRTYELQGPLAVPPGTYELEARLDSRPGPPAVRKAVEIRS